MRETIVFLLALGLGALTVSGQENEGDELRRRIRQLTEELRKRADRGAPEDRIARPVVAMYDVSDLAMLVTHARVWNDLFLVPSKYTPPEPCEELESAPPFEVDAIVDLMRAVVDPQTWDSVDGAEISVRGDRLLVRNVPRVHRKIPAFLKTLRRAADRQLRVEFIAIEATGDDAALVLNRPRELTEEEEKRLLERDALASITLHARSGQAVRQRMGREVSYLQDYDVEIAQEAAIGDPIRLSVAEGCSVWMRAFLDESARGARLDLEIDRSAIERPMRRVETEHGPLDLPVLGLTSVRTSVWVPLDRTVILGGSTIGANPCLYLVRARRFDAGAGRGDR